MGRVLLDKNIFLTIMKEVTTVATNYTSHPQKYNILI